MSWPSFVHNSEARGLYRSGQSGVTVSSRSVFLVTSSHVMGRSATETVRVFVCPVEIGGSNRQDIYTYVDFLPTYVSRHQYVCFCPTVAP